MTDFSSLGLSAIMLKSLNRLKFSDPTPIQAAAIPAALAGKDVLGTAQTGTGKTAAFGLPLVEHIAGEPAKRTALVITPTRELATQVQKAIESFIDRKQKIRTALLIGGEAYFKQRRALALNPAVIIGTPGRLNDHLTQGEIDLGGVTYLVLDETDRMLDMGFSVQIDSLLEGMGADRQTMLFSATLPPKIEKLAKTYMRDPVRISVGQQSEPAKDIAQSTVFLTQGEKRAAMEKILKENDGTAVVFVRTKYGTERVAKALSQDGFKAEALHGDLRQRKRDNVVQAFRAKKFRVLVATDVAARGLDIPHIELVINHDLPQVAEDYVHRIGRTARAGAQGQAISFVSPAEKNLWAAITRMLNPKSKNAHQDTAPGRSGPRKKARKKDSWSPTKPPRDDHDSFEGKSKGKRRDRQDAGGDNQRPPRKKDRTRATNKDKGKPAWAGKLAQSRSEQRSKDRRPRKFGDTPEARFEDSPKKSKPRRAGNGGKPAPKGIKKPGGGQSKKPKPRAL